jgi:hypothetical protein
MVAANEVNGTALSLYEQRGHHHHEKTAQHQHIEGRLGGRPA